MAREIASACRTDSLHLQNFTRRDGIFSSSSVSHNCRRRCRPRDRPTGGGDDDAAATTADEPCDIPRYGAHVGWTLRSTNLVASSANSNSVGHIGLDRNSIPTRCNSAGRRLPFRSLHRLQHVTVFSHASLQPPPETSGFDVIEGQVRRAEQSCAVLAPVSVAEEDVPSRERRSGLPRRRVYSLNAMTLGTGTSRLTARAYRSGYVSTTTAFPDRTALTVSCHDQMLRGSIRQWLIVGVQDKRGVSIQYGDAVDDDAPSRER
jgi:hypothetical protein